MCLDLSFLILVLKSQKIAAQDYAIHLHQINTGQGLEDTRRVEGWQHGNRRIYCELKNLIRAHSI